MALKTIPEGTLSRAGAPMCAAWRLQRQANSSRLLKQAGEGTRGGAAHMGAYLYDLYLLAQQPYDRSVVRQIAVIKSLSENPVYAVADTGFWAVFG